MASAPTILGALRSLEAAFPTTLTVICSAALTGILSGLETVLEKTTPCPCNLDLNTYHTIFVFVVPMTILFMVSLMVLPDGRKVLKCWSGKDSSDIQQYPPNSIKCVECEVCACSCSKLNCQFTVTTLLKALMPPTMWTAILLLDGDHVACSCLHLSAGTNRSCGEICNNNPTHQLSWTCFYSRVIGGLLLVVIVLIPMIFHISPTCKRCNTTWAGYCRIAEWAAENADEVTKKEKENVTAPKNIGPPNESTQGQENTGPPNESTQGQENTGPPNASTQTTGNIET